MNVLLIRSFQELTKMSPDEYHEWFRQAETDPELIAFTAGYEKAKSIYRNNRDVGQLSYLTTAFDHFFLWKEEVIKHS
jgi:hypothetical protein